MNRGWVSLGSCQRSGSGHPVRCTLHTRGGFHPLGLLGCRPCRVAIQAEKVECELRALSDWTGIRVIDCQVFGEFGLKQFVIKMRMGFMVHADKQDLT